ncbi:hypothetical protein TOPH_05920 [Tolypocladium ophioglossoides CBS 100239]|uniref:Uncharacterized protein n=1 Tax=Tolypocladium ophioglossoides (strain CBS 100239) TaxID=1163406 RepID=A0A0L0N644_TOLOC|nr:hypothetical protein TOPH_05920 [Tolypocladium ophioglossoides CBS 100239]
MIACALDVGIPPPHLLASNHLGPSAALLARRLPALEPDDALQLVHPANQPPLLDHPCRRLLGLFCVEAQQGAQCLEADVVV